MHYLNPSCVVQFLDGVAQQQITIQWILALYKKAGRLLGNLHFREFWQDNINKILTIDNLSLYIQETVMNDHIKAPETVKCYRQIHQYNTRHAAKWSGPWIPRYLEIITLTALLYVLTILHRLLNYMSLTFYKVPWAGPWMPRRLYNTTLITQRYVNIWCDYNAKRRVAWL